MVSILPSARTGLDVLGSYLGQGLTNAMPQMYENQKYQRGLQALEQAEKNLANVGNDPYRIALEFAKVGAAAPGLERALGPLMQTAMSRAQTQNAFGSPNQQPNANPQPMAPDAQPQMQQPPQNAQQLAPQMQQAPQQVQPGHENNLATPSPFNIMTGPEIDQDSEHYAKSLNDPNAYGVRQGQLNNLNNIAIKQREDLEDMALKSDVKPDELPRFMQVGSQFDPRNPSEWMQKTKRAYQKVKSNDKKLHDAFIPGIGQGLLGYDREKDLKKLTPTVQDQVRNGLETETREFLADNFVTPTEIELMIHPMTEKQEKAIAAFPRGFFPPEKSIFPSQNAPFISYDEALIKAPRQMQQIQDKLANFFMENVDDKTSLLGLRHKLWEDRDYDWQQIGPAIRQAEKMGLKLTQDQSTEMAQIETKPPAESLPDLFKDWSRIPAYLRGAK
jgi:hypothetical protein